jgi:hypothetical protein
MAPKKKAPKDVSDEKYPEIKPYPPSDDIYRRAKEEEDIDPENPNHLKTKNPRPDQNNERDFDEDMTGEDLDVPGNGPDERSEGNGDEDEENNYYSLPKNS